MKLVADSGARLLVTSCAECLRTWKIDYEPFFEGAPPKIQHISEFLADHMDEWRAEDERPPPHHLSGPMPDGTAPWHLRSTAPGAVGH